MKNYLAPDVNGSKAERSGSRSFEQRSDTVRLCFRRITLDLIPRIYGKEGDSIEGYCSEVGERWHLW